MTIYSLVTKRIEDGCWSGVGRFDFMLRKVFLELRSVMGPCPAEIAAGDIVITDNHLSLAVPSNIRTVVVHHGCAATHHDRDRVWWSPRSRELVQMQRGMFALPNRSYVAPSYWVAQRFRSEYGLNGHYRPQVIPHWVEPIEALPKSGRPIIIGDWRDHNKGSDVWKDLAKRNPQWEFRPLDFKDDAGRRKQYGEAQLYLCLSLSEGGAYSVCDAEAAGLPIVTTDVGNCQEFEDCKMIGWRDRSDLKVVSAAIEWKLKAGRRRPSFYRSYTFETWKSAWEAAIA